MPSSMLVVKYGVPVAGMMSTCMAIPDRSSTVESRQTGELTHSSRCSWWPGLRPMPKNGSPRRRSMISWSAPPTCPTWSAPYHSATASKYGRDRAGRRSRATPSGSSVCVLGHPAGPAGQGAPDPERRGERLAAPDRPVGGAEQPERGPRAGGQHQVARQRHAVPAQEPHRLGLGHARAEPASRPARCRSSMFVVK